MTAGLMDFGQALDRLSFHSEKILSSINDKDRLANFHSVYFLII